MLGASRLLVDRKRALEQGFGFRVAILLLIERRQIVEGLSEVGMAGARAPA